MKKISWILIILVILIISAIAYTISNTHEMTPGDKIKFVYTQKNEK